MEWMWIPGVLIVAVVALALLGVRYEQDGLKLLAAVVGVATFIAVLIAPSEYYSNRDDALRYAAYYDNVVVPLVTEEHDDYVVIDSFKAGTWNEGVVVLQEYNAYLAVNRYWDQHWLWGTLIYPAPDYLKPVRVAP